MRPLIVLLLATSTALFGCSSIERQPPTSIASTSITSTHAGNAPRSAPSSVVLHVPLIAQNPELPRGCEVTSLAMMLQHAGIHADKMTLAAQIDKVPFQTDGIHGDPHDAFVGDMYTKANPGYGVYHAPIERLAETYLPGRIIKLTGRPFDDILRDYVGRQYPVWIITNATFKKVPASEFKTWTTSKGDIAITMHEHSVVITGYDADSILINDPLDPNPNKALPRADFREAWEQMGSQAITYSPRE